MVKSGPVLVYVKGSIDRISSDGLEVGTEQIQISLFQGEFPLY